MGGVLKGNCRLISKKVDIRRYALVNLAVYPGIGESHIFKNSMFVFSVVELTMNNPSFTPNSVCTVLLSFVKIVFFFKNFKK